MKRKNAKEILSDSFREIAESKPIDKITIRDITENCGYSSATFYRQFEDKYDLIAWTYTQDLERIMDGLEYNDTSLSQVFFDVAYYYNDHREYLANLLMHTSGYDSFVHNMTEIHFNSLKTRILKGKQTMDVQTEMFVRIYIHGSVRLTCEWILGRYKAGIEELVEVYDQSLPQPLRKYLCEE